MKLSNLLDKDFKIVEKRKILFLVPVAIVIVAIVAMIIYGCVSGRPLNLGMDFTGGYSVNVKLSTKLTDETYEDYKKEITSIIENLKDENGDPYKLKVALIQRQGSGETASVYVRYKAVADDRTMEEEINPAIQKALQDKIFKIIPTITFANQTLTAEYADRILSQNAFEQMRGEIYTAATQNNIALTQSDISLREDGKAILIQSAALTDASADLLQESLTINDRYSGQAVKGDITSATVSSELLINAILAISLAVVLMLVYIAFRFEVSSGLSAIVALIHDIVVMFSFMAIFHIEINSTFIAALITILGYSINNTIIIFDRIREHTKSLFDKNSSATLIANRSVKETVWRSINTTLTTLITIGMVAILGVPNIRIFALPIIVGLLAGTFSSICVAPSVWAMWKDRKKKTPKNEHKAEKAEKVALA